MQEAIPRTGTHPAPRTRSRPHPRSCSLCSTRPWLFLYPFPFGTLPPTPSPHHRPDHTIRSPCDTVHGDRHRVDYIPYAVPHSPVTTVPRPICTHSPLPLFTPPNAPPFPDLFDRESGGGGGGGVEYVVVVVVVITVSNNKSPHPGRASAGTGNRPPPRHSGAEARRLGRE